MPHFLAMTVRLAFQRLFDGERWRFDVAIEVDGDGRIQQMGPAGPRESRIGGLAVPGLTNLHSHAFQRAMAGRAETVSPATRDSFWTWRERMYRLATTIDPAKLARIAGRLYRELSQAGFTSVVEFHYVHHQADGTPYLEEATMAKALIAAAEDAGLRLTLLPVLYQHGDFGAAEPMADQRRFVCSTNAYLRLLEAVDKAVEGTRHRTGVAFHSLRAVGPEAMREVLAARSDGDVPIHLHIAEQPREVEACARHHGTTPVAWLLDRFDVDERWCLVHATHATEDEIVRAARSGAVVGLCPTTEANLGDGLFALPSLLAADGAFGIGTDSHASVSPIEELRWLEYGQRLRTGRRNVVDRPSSDVGANLWMAAHRGGAQASGRSSAGLTVGDFADVVVVDTRGPAWAGATPEDYFGTMVFAGEAYRVRQVYVGGTALPMERSSVP